MLIEKLKESDYIEVEKIFKELYKTRSIKKIILQNPYTNFVVLKDDNEIIGLLNYDIIYERVELININIISLYQGKGLSKLLMDYLIKECGNKPITLEVRIDNYKAISLYKKYNFKEKTIRKNYYNGVDALLMERE